MADMDLREVLVEALQQAMALDRPTALFAADVARARLSRPDVLDEFERRCGKWVGNYEAEQVRAVLFDMLRGES